MDLDSHIKEFTITNIKDLKNILHVFINDEFIENSMMKGITKEVFAFILHQDDDRCSNGCFIKKEGNRYYDRQKNGEETEIYELKNGKETLEDYIVHCKNKGMNKYTIFYMLID